MFPPAKQRLTINSYWGVNLSPVLGQILFNTNTYLAIFSYLANRITLSLRLHMDFSPFLYFIVQNPPSPPIQLGKFLLIAKKRTCDRYELGFFNCLLTYLEKKSLKNEKWLHISFPPHNKIRQFFLLAEKGKFLS